MSKTKKIVLAALFLAIGLLLPFVTGQIPTIGKMLSPMHIPVILAGFILGPAYGAAIGFICPLLRAVLFGMPNLFPEAVGMAFELLTYGFVSGSVFRALKKKKGNRLLRIYITLIITMLAGRIVWGIVRYVIALLFNLEFPFKAFLSGAFLFAWPGIIVHLILIPVILEALYGSKLVKEE
ncbi:MAG: ECF transporter S component [Clostridia bacterium]|nr:ECF transporter S component [Clostridia bacterium]MBR3564494.1 ECF transporter S component [Clostridia bacterium]